MSRSKKKNRKIERPAAVAAAATSAAAKADEAPVEKTPEPVSPEAGGDAPPLDDASPGAAEAATIAPDQVNPAAALFNGIDVVELEALFRSRDAAVTLLAPEEAFTPLELDFFERAELLYATEFEDWEDLDREPSAERKPS